MFCGLPVIVAVLPTLEAIATPSRYGTGSRRSRRAMSTTSGVITRQIASLSRNAENTPELTITAASSCSGWWARATTQPLTSRKNPERRRLPTTIINPRSSARVGMSIALPSASSGTASTASIRLPPTSAAPARSIRSPGTRPIATTM